MRGHSAAMFDFQERNRYAILVSPNGDCEWKYPLKLLTTCVLNQKYFPFDHQECHLDFRSTGYTAEQLIIENASDDIEMKSMKEAEFDLYNSHLFHGFLVKESMNYSSVRVNLHLERKTLFYINKIIFPYFIFYIVTIFTFILPIESGEKKSFGTSILISAMIYLADTSYFIPKSTTMPILSIFFNLNLIYVFICLVHTTLNYLFYYYHKKKEPVPLSVRNLCHFLGFKFPKRYPPHQFDIDCTFTTIQHKISHISKELSNLESFTFHSKTRVRDVDRNEYLVDFKHQQDSLGVDCLNLLKTIKLFIFSLEEIEGIEPTVTPVEGTSRELAILKLQMKHLNSMNILESLKCLLNSTSNQNKNKKMFKKQMKNFDINQETLKNRLKKLSNDDAVSNKSVYINNTTTYDQNETFNYKASIATEMNSKGLQLLNLLNKIKSKIRNQIRLYETIEKRNFNEQIEFVNWKNGTQHLDYANEWKLLAVFLDRIIFLVFIIVVPMSLVLMAIVTYYYKTIYEKD
jgi:hypothetical protein